VRVLGEYRPERLRSWARRFGRKGMHVRILHARREHGHARARWAAPRDSSRSSRECCAAARDAADEQAQDQEDCEQEEDTKKNVDSRLAHDQIPIGVTERHGNWSTLRPPGAAPGQPKPAHGPAIHARRGATGHPPAAPRVPRLVRRGPWEDRGGGDRGAGRTGAPHRRGVSRGSPSRSP
jgi:hypothetical protein